MPAATSQWAIQRGVESDLVGFMLKIVAAVWVFGEANRSATTAVGKKTLFHFDEVPTNVSADVANGAARQAVARVRHHSAPLWRTP